MPLFPRLHQVIRRSQAIGAWVEGKWVLTEPVPTTVQLSVQPAGSSDFEQVQGMPGGQNISGLLRAYGGTAAPLKEGDLLLYDNARWVVISAPPPRDALGPDVAHVKYLLTRELPTGG